MMCLGILLSQVRGLNEIEPFEGERVWAIHLAKKLATLLPETPSWALTQKQKTLQFSKVT